MPVNVVQTKTRINRNIVECKDRDNWTTCIRWRVLIETLWNVKEAMLFTRLWWKSVLIETLWNVKEDLEPASLKFWGINRNIVECKEACKLLFLLDAFVLIETLWNVKFNRDRCVWVLDRVLIETLWNVKLGEWNGEESDTRINRNIVECKVMSHRLSQPSCFVLIETLWNVK